MTETTRKEFVNTNDKYNRITISIELADSADAVLNKFCETLKGGLTKILKDAEFEVRSFKRTKHSRPRIVVEINNEVSTKTCITMSEYIALLNPVDSVVTSGQLCYYPEWIPATDCDDDVDKYEGTEWIYVEMLQICYGRGNGWLSMNQLPFYYFEQIKRQFDVLTADTQAHVCAVSDLMHNIGSDDNRVTFFIPDGSKYTLRYKTDVDKMELTVVLPWDDAKKLKAAAPFYPNWEAEITAEMPFSSDRRPCRLPTVIINIDQEYSKTRKAEDRLGFLHWILHNFHVEQIHGQGYIGVPGKIDRDYAYVQVEAYDYQKGWNQSGSLVFDCVDPRLLEVVGNYGERAICELIGAALWETQHRTKESETVFILDRPSGLDVEWPTIIGYDCKICANNHWGAKTGFRGKYCDTQHKFEWIMGDLCCSAFKKFGYDDLDKPTKIDGSWKCPLDEDNVCDHPNLAEKGSCDKCPVAKSYGPADDYSAADAELDKSMFDDDDA